MEFYCTYPSGDQHHDNVWKEEAPLKKKLRRGLDECCVCHIQRRVNPTSSKQVEFVTAQRFHFSKSHPQLLHPSPQPMLLGPVIFLQAEKDSNGSFRRHIGLETH